jgi:diacylglycerol kinase (ATP)
MRYIFIVSSRAGAAQRKFVRRLLSSHFPGRRSLLLLDPPDILVDLLCRAYYSEGLRLIAVGGDGTIQRLLKTAVRYEIPIGILPCGTANDLARAIGLKRNLKECCDVIEADYTRVIDLIAVNGKLFATCGGLGLPSSVAILHNCHRKKAPRLSAGGFRKASYFLNALLALGRKHSVNARIHGSRLQWSGCAMAVVISNQPRFGALFSVSLKEVNNDGIFDLCIISDPANRIRELRIVLQAALGKETIGQGVGHCCLRHARILTDGIVPFWGDGEILSYSRNFRIDILPRAVRLIVPERASIEEVRARRLSPTVFHPGIWKSKAFDLEIKSAVRTRGGQDKSVGFIGNNTASKPGPNPFT